MELEKISVAELGRVEDAKLKELVTDINVQKAKLRMDIYAEKKKNQGVMRKLRKSMARVQTVISQRRLSGAESKG